MLAAPPSRVYRLRKFVRKHRAGVIAASLVLLALVAGIAGTTLGLFEARRHEAMANQRAEGERRATSKALAAAEEEKKAKETVEAVLTFVEDKIFAAARPKDQAGGLGYDVKLADAITAALPSIENSFPDKPLTEARLRSTIGHFLQLPGQAGDRGRAMGGGSVAQQPAPRPRPPQHARVHDQPGQQLLRPRPARRGPQAPRGDAGAAEDQARPRPPRHAREHVQPGHSATTPSAGTPRPSSSTRRRWPFGSPGSAPTTPTRSIA